MQCSTTVLELYIACIQQLLMPCSHTIKSHVQAPPNFELISRHAYYFTADHPNASVHRSILHLVFMNPPARPCDRPPTAVAHFRSAVRIAPVLEEYQWLLSDITQSVKVPAAAKACSEQLQKGENFTDMLFLCCQVAKTWKWTCKHVYKWIKHINEVTIKIMMWIILFDVISLLAKPYITGTFQYTL